MITLHSDKGVACFDVDDTLIMWHHPEADTKIVDPHDEWTGYFKVHEPHVEKIKKCKEEGKVVIVWSQTGGDWADAVVRALGLEGYVDLCRGKPTEIYDDLSTFYWMPKRRYLELDGKERRIDV